MDRYWLLTTTTYGTWLPGDDRGSVTRVREHSGPRELHNQADSPIDGAMPGLQRSAADKMHGRPVRLTEENAVALLAQWRETAGFAAG